MSWIVGPFMIEWHKRCHLKFISRQIFFYCRRFIFIYKCGYINPFVYRVNDSTSRSFKSISKLNLSLMMFMFYAYPFPIQLPLMSARVLLFGVNIAADAVLRRAACSAWLTALRPVRLLEADAVNSSRKRMNAAHNGSVKRYQKWLATEWNELMKWMMIINDIKEWREWIVRMNKGDRFIEKYK